MNIRKSNGHIVIMSLELWLNGLFVYCEEMINENDPCG